MLAFLHVTVVTEKAYSPYSLFAHYDQALAFDHAAVDYIAASRQEWLETAARFFTFFGEVEIGAILIALVLGLLWYKRLHVWIVPFILAVIGAQATTTLLKLLIARPRPNVGLIAETTYSFPSGHATIAAVIFGYAGLIVATKTGRNGYIWLGAVFAALVAASRVILGVHYPNDVIAGLLIGGGWVLITKYLCEKSRQGHSGII